MFNFCLCSKKKRSKFDSNSKYYDDVNKKLSDDEQVMLELIYNDLASRNNEKKISLENFLLFFNLTGLWGAKLFRQFDQDGKKLITKQEFFFGISKTAKASYEQKIKLLYNFFKDEQKENNGVKFVDFKKMLYNYSRDELKEILIEDRYLFNPAFTKNNGNQQIDSNSIASFMSIDNCLKKNASEHKIIQLNYVDPIVEHKNSFEKNYAQFSEYKDPGTCVELKLNNALTFKINYCNMITLVSEFATRIYKYFQVDIKKGKLSYQQFEEWIKSHSQLFKSYYTSFHNDVWTYSNSDPIFLGKIEKSFQGKIMIGSRCQSVYGMLVEDVLVIADSFKKRKQPYKIIYLSGLDMTALKDSNGYGIEIKHRDEIYPKTILYFASEQIQLSYMKSFEPYEGEVLQQNYDCHEVIGTGKFSIVYRCTSKQTKKTLALKDINIEKLSQKVTATIKNQSQILKIISHPQIVKYEDTLFCKSHIYIVTEYIYGIDLFEYVKKKKHLSEYFSAYIIGKIIEAVIYLHSMQIIHRDLKPQNIMVMMKKKSYQNIVNVGSFDMNELKDEEAIENIKIIDFGLSNHLSEIEQNQQSEGLIGTPNYIAPEVIIGEKTTYQADSFSIGSILFFLLSGKLAFAKRDIQTTLIRSASGNYDMQEEVWKQVSDEAKDLISKLLIVDPTKRMQLDQALNHPWFDVVISKQKQKKDKLNLGEKQTQCQKSEARTSGKE